MGILHRHILASVAATFAAAVALFAFLLIAGQALRELLGYVIAGQLAPATALRLIGLLVPFVASYALPIGLLTAVLLVLGRMSSQQELTAMRAAGLSIGYIVRPVWLLAGAAVLLSLGLNYYLMPAARTAYRRTLIEAVRQNPLNFIVPKTFVRDFPGVVVYVGDRKGPRLNDFWLWRLDDQKRVLSVARAKTGTMEFRDADSCMVLTLHDVSVETRNRDRPEDFSKPQPVATSDSLTVELKMDSVFKQLNVTPKVNWMTYDQLAARRHELLAKETRSKEEKRELTRVTMVLSEKAASSFAVLALALVAVPLGIKVSRKETTANLGIAVGLLLGYYFLGSLAGMLERSPALRPELWVWAPPMLYVAVGLWLFRRVGRA